MIFDFSFCHVLVKTRVLFYGAFFPLKIVKCWSLRCVSQVFVTLFIIFVWFLPLVSIYQINCRFFFRRLSATWRSLLVYSRHWFTILSTRATQTTFTSSRWATWLFSTTIARFWRTTTSVPCFASCATTPSRMSWQRCAKRSSSVFCCRCKVKSLCSNCFCYFSGVEQTNHK